MSRSAHGAVAFSASPDPIGDGLVASDAAAADPGLVAAPAIAAPGGGGGGGGAASYYYMPMPQLMGAPAYARPRRIVAEAPRPFDPDDLPLEAFRGPEDEALLSNTLGQARPPSEPTLAPSSQGGLRAVAARLFGNGA